MKDDKNINFVPQQVKTNMRRQRYEGKPVFITTFLRQMFKICFLKPVSWYQSKLYPRDGRNIHTKIIFLWYGEVQHEKPADFKMIRLYKYMGTFNSIIDIAW